MYPDRPNKQADVRRRLRRRWRFLCDWLNLTGDTATVWERLRGCYEQPWRTYHNLTHIEDCIDVCTLEVDFGDEQTTFAMEMAIFFHDAIYEIGTLENERRSAGLARESLTSLGATPVFVDRVAGLVLATDHKRLPRDEAAAALCDVDLSILARSAAEYDRYAKAIHDEVALPAEEFAPYRRAFLQAMLSKTSVVHTEHFRQKCESVARLNMQRELRRWDERFAK